MAISLHLWAFEARWPAIFLQGEEKIAQLDLRCLSMWICLFLGRIKDSLPNFKGATICIE
jgi:hypothetical protein